MFGVVDGRVEQRSGGHAPVSLVHGEPAGYVTWHQAGPWTDILGLLCELFGKGGQGCTPGEIERPYPVLGSDVGECDPDSPDTRHVWLYDPQRGCNGDSGVKGVAPLPQHGNPRQGRKGIGRSDHAGNSHYYGTTGCWVGVGIAPARSYVAHMVMLDLEIATLVI